MFLRHAHAEHNAASDEHGEIAYTWEKYADALLTEKGKYQARNVVLPVKPDRVYSSPLRRCIQTIREFIPEDRIYLRDGLIERQCDHPCNRRSDIKTIQKTSHNIDFSRLQAEIIVLEEEDDDALVTRAKTTLEEIVRDAENAKASNILIVTHWDYMRTLFDKNLSNCEVYCVEARVDVKD